MGVSKSLNFEKTEIVFTDLDTAMHVNQNLTGTHVHCKIHSGTKK